MLSFALKMLIGDRAKFLGILFGLTFASFIITQQMGIFVGLLQRTYGFLLDTPQPDIWVMDPSVQHTDDIKGMDISLLFQTKSIEGVAWAVPLFKGLIKARFSDGNLQTCNVIGIDDPTLIGGPARMREGRLENLRMPDGVIVNYVGATDRLAHVTPNGKRIPLNLGTCFELNDQRARVVGICDSIRTFQSQPVIYTTFKRALHYAPAVRHSLSFVLVKAEKGTSVKQLVKTLRKQTGMAAYTTKDFRNLSLKYYLTRTGIPINFGIAVLLGFIIGIAISGQTFYTYAQDNLRYFATFKAMGASNTMLIKMMLVQALMIASLGWSFGIGFTAIFGALSYHTDLSFTLPWWLFMLSGFSIYGMTFFAALISVMKVIRLEPGVVFQS